MSSRGANGYQLAGAIGLAVFLLSAVFILNLILAFMGAPQSVWLMQMLGVM